MRRALLLAALLLATSAAQAQDDPEDARTLEARALFEEGVRMSRAERWAEALDRFRRSVELVPRPRTLFNIAIALDRLGRVRETIEAIDRFLASEDHGIDEEDRREAARLRVEAEARLAHLLLSLEPGSAQVEVDGVPQSEGARSLELDPGDHVLVVRAPGHADHRERLSVPPGAVIERALRLTPLEPVDPPRASADIVIATPAAAREEAHAPGLAEEPVFWVILASAAVVIGVGVGVGVWAGTQEGPPAPYGGTTGLTFTVP